ncbi:MAG: hypothetical protein HYW33_01935 [Candidatus Blackburnbacteria bacterium]|nr:hypothetical protein [Candidatus Blackburnbacteria bacterium]
MNQTDLAALTIYHDLLTTLRERGYTESEAAEIFANLTAQAEMEVVEELISKLTDEQLARLRDLPENATGEEIASQMEIGGEEVDAIRAQKVTKLLSELAPVVDANDDQIV